MNYWYKVKNIIYRPDFFINRSFEIKKALSFYSVLLAVFVALKILVTLPSTAHFYQTVFSDAWQKEVTTLTRLYPEELQITFKDGIISTNVSEPYAIAFPEEWRQEDESLPKNLIVIDTTKSIETSSFQEKNTLFILGKNDFGYNNASKGEFRMYNFDKQKWKEDARLNKKDYDTFITKGSALFRFVLLSMVLILPIFLYVILWIGYALYLLFGAIVVSIVAKIRGHQWSYEEAYMASIYLLPVPFFYDFLSSLSHGSSSTIPFVFTFILFFMALINLPKITPKESSTEPTIETKKETSVPHSDVPMV